MNLSILQWQAANTCYSVLDLQQGQSCFLLYFSGFVLGRVYLISGVGLQREFFTSALVGTHLCLLYLGPRKDLCHPSVSSNLSLLCSSYLFIYPSSQRGSFPSCEPDQFCFYSCPRSSGSFLVLCWQEDLFLLAVDLFLFSVDSCLVREKVHGVGQGFVPTSIPAGRSPHSHRHCKGMSCPQAF